MSLALLAKDPLFGIASDGRGIIIFGLEIYYYALVIVAGMLIAAALSMLLMRRRNMSSDFVFLLFLVCIPTAIIGARLFSCLTDESIGLKNFFKIRQGGMSITGGVLGGVGAGLAVCLIKKVNFFRAADCVVLNILIAQALGRWGNYFNGEVYGGVVSNPAQQWFPFAVNINGTWHYAFFFYEMLWNMLGWALLFTYAWFRKKKPNGILTCLYFVWYGSIRMVMEPLRDPEFILNKGGTPWSEVFAIAMVGLGIAGCMLLMIINFFKEGSFEGSKRGDPCGITSYLKSSKNEVPYYSKINMFGANYPPRPPKKKKGEAPPSDDAGDPPPDESKRVAPPPDDKKNGGNP